MVDRNEGLIQGERHRFAGHHPDHDAANQTGARCGSNRVELSRRHKDEFAKQVQKTEERIRLILEQE